MVTLGKQEPPTQLFSQSKGRGTKGTLGSFSVPLIPVALLRDALRLQYASFSSEVQLQTPEGLGAD